jgi:sec-independent protein translocase protein TatA
MSLGPWEIVIVVLVIIILFGGKKIPELARGLVKGLKEFRKTTKDLKDEVNSTAEDVKNAVDETKE